MFDATAEDCTTGITISTDEGTNMLFVADLSAAVFLPPAPGSPFHGSWTAPSQFQTIADFDFMGFPPQFGAAGVAIAPNTHVGLVTGEFGGNGIGAIRLPAASGKGIPALVDWARADLPNEPDGMMFNTGLDPHTSTAYVSPGSNKPFGIVTDVRLTESGATAPPAYFAVVDLEGLLTAPRTAGTHRVVPSFDLIANGVVRYVLIH